MAQSKVLIVEDDEGLREALVDTLALAGYEWLEADSAEDALVKLKSNAVDIVVSDAVSYTHLTLPTNREV